MTKNLRINCLRGGVAVAALLLAPVVSLTGMSLDAATDRSVSLQWRWVAPAHADDDDGGGGDGGDDGGNGGAGHDGGDDGRDSGRDSDHNGADHERDTESADTAAGDAEARDEREEHEQSEESEEEVEELDEAEEAEEAEREAEEFENIAITTGGDNDDAYVRGQVIGVGVTAAGRDAIARLGAKVVDTDYYAQLGMTLTRVDAAVGPNTARLEQLLNRSGTGLYGLNHAYRLAAADGATLAQPLSLLGWAGRPASCGADVRLGIVDTAVDTQQLQARKRQIRMRRFAPGQPVAARHGTAIASLLLGAPPNGPRGALPAAELLVADVYRLDAQGEPLALTTDLLAALNWLAARGVKVINMSLAGPPDQLLQRAIRRLQQQGIVVVAAAGNGGPLAPPAYPAAYTDVIAVTAVNAQLQVFARANRGDYVDIAAPGVGLRVPPGRRVQGTSLAAIYVSAAVADAASSGMSTSRAVRRVLAGARDLGPNGPDPTFGHGFLLKPLACN